MTTIIVIVVVALVFFVTVCVVTFMVWKRETEMRTDSIRAIESNLEKLGDRLAADADAREDAADAKGRRGDGIYGMETAGNRTGREESPGFRRRESADPFGWVRQSDDEPIFTSLRKSSEISEAPENAREFTGSAQEESTDGFVTRHAEQNFGKGQTEASFAEDEAAEEWQIPEREFRSESSGGYRQKRETEQALYVKEDGPYLSHQDSDYQDLAHQGAVKDGDFDEAEPAGDSFYGQSHWDEPVENYDAPGDAQTSYDDADAWLDELMVSDDEDSEKQTVSERIADNHSNDTETNTEAAEEEDEDDYAEINLDFGDEIDALEDNLKREVLPPDGFSDSLERLDMSEFEESRYTRPNTGERDVGRSGKKYTAEELDMLIKE